VICHAGREVKRPPDRPDDMLTKLGACQRISQAGIAVSGRSRQNLVLAAESEQPLMIILPRTLRCCAMADTGRSAFTAMAGRDAVHSWATLSPYERSPGSAVRV